MKFQYTMAGALAAAILAGSPVFAQNQNNPAAGQSAGAPAAAAEGQQPGTPAAAAEGQQPGAAQAPAMSQQQMEQHFVKEAAEGNMFEVKLGQFVKQRTDDGQARQMADRLIQDHTQANQHLQQAVQAKQLQLPKDLDPVHQAILNHFEQLQGKELSRAFVIDQVGDHVKDILKYRDAAKEIQDPQIKQYIQQTMPTLREHLQMAESMAGWSGEAQPASARQHGTGTTATPPGNDANTPGSSQTPGQSGESTPGASTPGASTPGGASTPEAGTPGSSTPGASTPGTSTPEINTPRAGAGAGTSR